MVDIYALADQVNCLQWMTKLKESGVEPSSYLSFLGGGKV